LNLREQYDQYEKAVFHALIERFAEGETVVLMVVGAGRGPLVRASLRASEAAKRPIRVYAVEKNPNALVTYVFSDMNCVGVLAG